MQHRMSNSYPSRTNNRGRKSEHTRELKIERKKKCLKNERKNRIMLYKFYRQVLCQPISSNKW